jgi:hypothetical protein
MTDTSETTDDVLGVHPALDPAEDASAFGGRRSLRVLVAEDNLVNQQIARGFLEREAIGSSSPRTGRLPPIEQALEKAENASVVVDAKDPCHEYPGGRRFTGS